MGRLSFVLSFFFVFFFLFLKNCLTFQRQFLSWFMLIEVVLDICFRWVPASVSKTMGLSKEKKM